MSTSPQFLGERQKVRYIIARPPQVLAQHGGEVAKYASGYYSVALVTQ
jgi:hypothetical protein